MKTVTIDYVEYEQELKNEFAKGMSNGSEALSEARSIITSVVRREYSSVSEIKLHEWLRKYQDKI